MPSMNNKTRRALVILPWAALPAVLLTFYALWERLPERLAVHFDASGEANGWMSRRQFFAFSAGVLLFLLASFTWRLRAGEGDGNFYVKMLAYYAGTIFLTGVLLFVLRYNL
jgi:uncharacterized membrane protein